MREVSIERNTNETQIELTLNLDGAGRYQVDTGCGFLNHMLELFARHGRFDLVLTCHGDVEVDYHHTTEDIGIALGQAFAKALGDMRGIRRYGSFTLPMDEALILCAVDISGRCTLNWDVHCKTEKVGDFDVECVQEFWLGFVRNLPGTVHFVQFAGENTHHILEACFKGAGRALAEAVRIDAAHRDEIPSTSSGTTRFSNISRRVSTSITSTAITADTVPPVRWPSVITPSRSRAWCGRARCTARSSTRRRAATPGCGS